ncbi:MAG: L-rhamnose mutarotase [Cyclobacteriaceae bacterium]
MRISFILTLLFIGFMMGCDNSASRKEENISKPPDEKKDNRKIQRYGMVIRIRPEKISEYKALHAKPWPGVLKQITESNIRNYSIYLKDDYLFGYFEYTGDDFEADMKKMARDSLTREWWKLTDPCQIPLETRKEGEWWSTMEEVFHHP